MAQAPFAGGSGTEGDPWHVATATQLDSVRNYLSAHFIQTADIDLDVAPYKAGYPSEKALAFLSPAVTTETDISSQGCSLTGELNSSGCLVPWTPEGRNVATLLNEQKTPGRYQVNFDASRLASGLYIYRLKVGSNVLTKKMMLIK